MRNSVKCAGAVFVAALSAQVTPIPAPKSGQENVNALTKPAPPVIPNADRYDVGRLSTFNEMHDAQIKDLLSRMSSVETSINWGRGLIAGISTLLVGIIVFLKSFWKPILRMLINESSNPPSAPSAPTTPQAPATQV